MPTETPNGFLIAPRSRPPVVDGRQQSLSAIVNRRPGATSNLNGRQEGHESTVSSAALVAFFLKQQRGLSGKTPEQVVQKLSHTSVNAYARYEHGAPVSTIDKLTELLRALEADADFVLRKSAIRKGA